MIDISELEVFFINVDNYLDNPKAKECFEENCKRLKGAKIKVLSVGFFDGHFPFWDKVLSD
jgi:hypothetical protein